MDLADVYNLEGQAESPDEYARSMQRAINGGQVWRMQGSYGRAAMDALEAGLVMLPDTSSTDYYGNRIPARSDLEPGTKGTRELVVAQHGEAWAEMLDNVD